jgi:hypothetical protein
MNIYHEFLLKNVNDVERNVKGIFLNTHLIDLKINS